jgi:hypothetical protein
LKKQGLNVESSLVEKGERLEKLVVLAASAAVRTMQLTLAREGNTTRPASDTFTKEEQDFWSICNRNWKARPTSRKIHMKREHWRGLHGS